MAELTDGIFQCTVLSAKAGEDDRGAMVARINIRFDEGPNTGMTGTYEEQVNMKSAPYIKRSCDSVGWKGQSLRTLEADAAEWIASTGGQTTAEVHSVEIKRGKKYDAWIAAGAHGDPPTWKKVRSVGRGPKALHEPKGWADADEAMRSVNDTTGEETPF